MEVVHGQKTIFYKPQTKHVERKILLAVHKNTCERTFEYAGAQKQTAEKARFYHPLSFSLPFFFFFFLIPNS